MQSSRVSKSIKREVPRIGTLVHLFLAFDILASNTVADSWVFFCACCAIKNKNYAASHFSPFHGHREDVPCGWGWGNVGIWSSALTMAAYVQVDEKGCLHMLRMKSTQQSTGFLHRLKENSVCGWTLVHYPNNWWMGDKEAPLYMMLLFCQEKENSYGFWKWLEFIQLRKICWDYSKKNFWRG